MSHPHVFDPAEEHGHHQTEPIDVRVVGKEETTRSAPEFSSWQSWVLDPVNVKNPVRVLADNQSRARAVVTVGPGAAGNVAGYVLVGNKEKIQQGQGGRLANGQSVTIEGRPPLWVISDGANSLTVTVLDERYK